MGLVVVAGALAVACGGSSSPAGATDVGSSNATAAAKGIKLVRVGKFDSPTYLAGAPGDTHRLFVLEKAGRIIVVVNGHKRERPFLDIAHLVQSSSTEQGLLGLAFPLDYQQTGSFYVAYTIANNDVRIAQYSRSGRQPQRGRPRQRQARADRPAPLLKPQRRTARVRSRTVTCTSGSATAAARATR